MKTAHRLQLDRMAIEEAGPDPRRLAAAIHAQLPGIAGVVPVHEIAYALDIVEIRTTRTIGFEAALVAPMERGEGGILINEKSSYPRQRYSIGHELCHFLNPRHQPTSPSGRFACSSIDLSTFVGPDQSAPGMDARHRQQEAEANRFAIELLAPPRLVSPHLNAEPHLASVIALASALKISKEASARRYVELHRLPAAVVFSRDGKVRYVECGTGFPTMICRPGQFLDKIPSANQSSDLSDPIAVDPVDWLQHWTERKLTIQTLFQQGRYAMTMLTLAKSTQV